MTLGYGTVLVVCDDGTAEAAAAAEAEAAAAAVARGGS